MLLTVQQDRKVQGTAGQQVKSEYNIYLKSRHS